jgi:REP element-mobilizing transposase RayT
MPRSLRGIFVCYKLIGISTPLLVLSPTTIKTFKTANSKHKLRCNQQNNFIIFHSSFAPLWCCHQQKQFFYIPLLIFMLDINFDYHPQFFTATILEWKHLLHDDIYKDIIIKSLLYLKKEKSIVIYGFVIMPNHIHLIWQIQDGFKQAQIQHRFLKFTAQQMKFKMIDTNDSRLNDFLVNTSDRTYQI